MSSQMLNIVTTLPAFTDYSATPYRLMAIGTAQDYKRASAATVFIAGVLLNKPQAGEAANIATAGIALVEAGAAVAVGARLTTDASGRGIPTVTAGDYSIGQAIDSASAAGEVIRVQVCGFRL